MCDFNHFKFVWLLLCTSTLSILVNFPYSFEDFFLCFVLLCSINVKQTKLVYCVIEVFHFLVFLLYLFYQFLYYYYYYCFSTVLHFCIKFIPMSPNSLAFLFAAFNILFPIICNLNFRKTFNYYFSLSYNLYFVSFYVHVCF